MPIIMYVRVIIFGKTKKLASARRLADANRNSNVNKGSELLVGIFKKT